MILQIPVHYLIFLHNYLKKKDFKCFSLMWLSHSLPRNLSQLNNYLWLIDFLRLYHCTYKYLVNKILLKNSFTAILCFFGGFLELLEILNLGFWCICAFSMAGFRNIRCSKTWCSEVFEELFDYINSIKFFNKIVIIEVDFFC